MQVDADGCCDVCRSPPGVAADRQRNIRAFQFLAGLAMVPILVLMVVNAIQTREQPMKHSVLVESAKEAVDKVFGDKSVSPSKTIESLEEIVEHAESQIGALKEEQRGKSDD